MQQKIWLVSFLSIISGLGLIFLWPRVYNCVVSLHCNPVLYLTWKNIPFLIKTDFFLFNWTNPEDFYNTSIKPKFQECGPYVFYQKEEKCDIVWNNNGTVTYKQKRFWYYDEKSSSLEDKIVNIDRRILSLSYTTRFWNRYLRKMMFAVLPDSLQTYYSTHTAKELLFEGYPDPTIKMARALPLFSSLKLPAWDKFGWLYARNGSKDADGVFNMGTGSNSSILGKMHQWNYQSKTEYFEDICGKILGSSTQFFPRNLDRSPLEMFSSDLRRWISVKFDNEKTMNGILGYTYTAGKFAMDNGTMNQKNKCFCVEECLPSGLINISTTRFHAPVFGSLPHLYGADPYYFNSIDGLKPEKQKHDFFVTIEPNTGFVIEGSPRIQINLLMHPIIGTKLFENVPTRVFPVFWSQQDLQIPGYFLFALKVVLAFPTIAILLGMLMVLLGLFWPVYVTLRRKPKKTQDERVQEHLLNMKSGRK